MSYILEALKKSESERNQGRVPDLGQQMRMIHRNRKRGIPAAAWLALALLVNAFVMAALFWPGYGFWSADPDGAGEVPVTVEPARAVSPSTPVAADEPAKADDAEDPAGPTDMTAASGDRGVEGVSAEVVRSEAPTVIVPTVRGAPYQADGATTDEAWEGRVPHLVELPMAFQRQVPDLVFNSHVYSDDPWARSVMINNRLLRMGESFGPLRVELITEQGVELSMDGQRFRVGVVRDWSSPR
ncbi:general secretion pathway protein B [Marinobacter daqiaonensis]|uniref:General secretion pathway protein B n=1 Tax=Marinobacter daqiaonensis TaxID=650891 RepID=A0A1I6GWW1_9GAMM|nr:general secretion pathway protein GspB [Marinobacter daqiaonensis]SFR46668.1 general secretion pathway protein B [Marinobacter daqiaonensis]